MSDPSELIRWPDVAQMLGITTRNVLDVINSGALGHPERGEGRDMYVRRSAVAEYLAAQSKDN